jgi:2-amino-4-hydroxy-6-hydroxymethyldihydropteridine diphosphokinase
MNAMTRSYVGLGSNLGDREAFLVGARAALAATPGVSVVAASRICETEPVGPPQGRYLNAVLALDTTLAAHALLERLLELEQLAGRRRGPERNAPRTLDLDLLLFGDLCLDTPELTLPHPRLHERAFVLVPLAEIAADVVHPRLAVSVRDLAAGVQGDVQPWPAARVWAACSAPR